MQNAAVFGTVGGALAIVVMVAIVLIVVVHVTVVMIVTKRRKSNVKDITEKGIIIQ